MSIPIKRKPISSSVPGELDPRGAQYEELFIADDTSQSKDVPLEEIEKIDSPTGNVESPPSFDEQLKNLQLETADAERTLNVPGDAITEESGMIDRDLEDKLETSKFKAALGEVRHFAGGLISHPYEATRHFSILRHSHGLVYYKGSATSVAITIFSDQKLPTDRKLWLQKRGFSGRLGLKMGATLGSRSAWIDVTPNIDASADLLPKNDERAWQRDVSKFLKKARDAKHVSKHRPCETTIVRIPYAADDGYFRLVLCAGREVLCPSPIFRYASLSLDPSTLRGASLRTLPLELGIRVASIVAHTTANTAAHGALQPAISSFQTVTQPYALGGATQWAATTAYDSSGAADKVDGTLNAINQRYDEKRDLANIDTADGAVDSMRKVNSLDGPQQPYPVNFSGKVASSLSTDQKPENASIFKLTEVPEHILLRLCGTYMGWVSISRSKISRGSSVHMSTIETWYKAVVVVLVQQPQEVQVVQQKNTFVHILQDLGPATMFSGTKLNVILMASLRTAAVSNQSIASYTGSQDFGQLQIANDMLTASLSLSRPAWAPETALERIRSESSTRSFTERMADARQNGQAKLDKVPVHKLGVRTASMGRKDELIGVGGICIKR